MKIREISAIAQATGAFLDDKDSKADHRTEYRLGVNFDKAEQALVRFNKQKAKIDEEFILRDKDGKPVPNMVPTGEIGDDGKIVMEQQGFKVKDTKGYQDAINDLADEDVEIDFRKIELSRLEDATGLTGILFKYCSCFIVEDEEQ